MKDWIVTAMVIPGLLLNMACSAKDASSGDENGQQQSSTTYIGSPSSNADWPRFRGPDGQGQSDASGLPLSWSAQENMAWKVRLPGAGSSSPIVIGDHIYLTCYSGYLVPGEAQGSLNDLARHLLCLNREDGALLWNKPVKATLPEESGIRDHGYAANTPVTDADRVYTFFGKSGVFAYSHEGDQLWQADVGSNTHGWGTAASPILYKNLVIVNASVESTSLVALDRRTGEEQWRSGGINEAWNTPLIVQTTSGADELVVATHGKVLAFDPLSGRQLWSCDTDITWYMVPGIIEADGVVYVLGGRSGIAALAVRTGGRGDVTATHRLWTGKTGSNVASPVYKDGYLYWAHESRETVHCAHAVSGELEYSEKLPRMGQVYSAALLAEDRVYYLNRSGTVYVLAARPEFEVLSTNVLNDGSLFNSSPVVSGNRLLLRSDKFLYCIGN
jgi:outer membrane protein assembly factor BamB